MIKETKLQTLANEYSDVSSWAIWNPKDYTDLSIIDSNNDKLLSNVVMVGLNVSANIKQKWQNFHMGSNDKKLMNAFNDSSYRGAYMTDIIKDLPESNSKKVLDDLTDKQLDDNFKRFKKEMELLGADKNTLFILFGNQVKELFLKDSIFYYNNIVCCMHYSYYGITEDEWIRQTHETLGNHVKRTKDIFNTRSFKLYR